MARLSGVPVVYVSDAPGPRLGGSEVYLMHLVRGALAAGLDVTVVAMPDSGVAQLAEEAGARVIDDDLARKGPYAGGRRLAEHARGRFAAVIHGTSPATNVLAGLAGKRAEARVVQAVHHDVSAPFLTVARAVKRRPLARRLWPYADGRARKKADALVVDSRVQAEALVARGVPANRVFVVHNGVDPTGLLREGAQAARPELPDHGIFVGTLSRLDPRKGLDVLFDAVPLIAAEHPDARFLIAGEGAEAETLQLRVATDPVLSKRVVMLGHVPSAPAFLAALDVYCLPSRAEGFDTTVLEAMALGVPVVATDAGGTREAVEDGVTGRLVPPGDPEALAAALGEMLGDALGRERLADAARVRIEADFTVQTTVGMTLAIYERLLNGT